MSLERLESTISFPAGKFVNCVKPVNDDITDFIRRLARVIRIWGSAGDGLTS